MTSALLPFMPGQTFAQTPQPMQSRGETCMRNCVPLSPVVGLVTKVSGFSVASSMTAGRMHACGQTKEHWLHWMQFSGSHFGTLTATPRFSNLVVPTGTEPSALNAEVGSLSPSSTRMGCTTFLKYSSSATATIGAPSVAFAQLAG